MAGVISGGVRYVNRSAIREPHSEGTAAWGIHLALAAITVVLLVAIRLRRRRRDDRGLLLLAPVGAQAGRRLHHTLCSSPVRTVVAAPAIGLLLYTEYRAGLQVLGGLDPNFTVNAWGGASYAGAMICHYLDLALMAAASGWQLHRILVPASPRQQR